MRLSSTWFACLLVACSAHAQPTPFIDAHVHLNDPAMQLRLMEAHGATHAVVFWGGRSDNASVLQAAERHAPRLIAFASISPERTAYRPAWQSEDPALLAELDAMLSTGRYKGIGEINAVHFPSAGFPETDFDPGGPMLSGILALARKHRVPVLVHIELTRLREFEGLLERFRDVPVIWAHGGYTPLVEAWPQRFVIGTDAANRNEASDGERYASVQNFLGQLKPGPRDAVASGNLRRLLGM